MSQILRTGGCQTPCARIVGDPLECHEKDSLSCGLSAVVSGNVWESSWTNVFEYIPNV